VYLCTRTHLAEQGLHDIRIQMHLNYKLSAMHALALNTKRYGSQELMHAVLRWRNNRAEALGLEIGIHYRQLLEIKDWSRHEEAAALSRIHTVESERELLQVRLSVMESDFEASRGVANAGMANAGIIHELMQALPVFERRLSEARRRREVLQSQVAPVLASCSGDLPGLVELRRFADQTRDACSMICSKSDALEVMHVEAVDGATCCMHQMESHVQQMVVEKQHGDAARELAKD